MKKNYIILLVGVILLVALDQITKQIIASSLELNEHIVVIQNFFTITSHRNDGGAWSIFNGQMGLFYVITAGAAVLFYFLVKETDFTNKKWYSYGVLLMIAGGIGNFIDRLLFQEVIDFLDFIIFGYDFPTFNVADICLVVGVILFGIDIFIEDILSGKLRNQFKKQ
jgi:signal peptidase II